METLFGKGYEVLGNSESDLLLKTKGDIKAQIGNQYVSLLTLRIVNSVVSATQSPGLYLNTSNGILYLVVNNSVYQISANKI